MIKLKIYKHSSIKTPIDDDIKKIPLYFASDFVKQYINEEIIYDIENTTLDYKDDRLFKLNEKDYDVVMFIYEKGTFPLYGECSYYSTALIKCYCSVNPIEDNIDYSWKVFVHELLHAIWYITMLKTGKYIPNLLDTYYKNDEPYAPDGNFAKQLEVLKPFYIKKYKYFSPKEIVGLKPELVEKLDKMRGECGFAFKINSGYRTKEYNNTLKDAVVDSAHTTGEAVDIACTDSTKRMKMISVAFMNGIERIGIADTYLHFDISKDKPQKVVWLY